MPCPQSGTAEVELKKGAKLKITLDNAYMEKCDENTLWLDYKNICKVVEVGSKIYVDDGLISLQVKEKGEAGQAPFSEAPPVSGPSWTADFVARKQVCWVASRDAQKLFRSPGPVSRSLCFGTP